MPSWHEVESRAEFDFLVQLRSRPLYYAGMGGSALPADLLCDYFRGNLRLHIVRDYRLPDTVGSQDVVICASFSGNTEETLSIFRDALSRRCRMIVLTHGGTLGAWAMEHAIPWIAIPDCIQPRCATGYFFGSLLALLHRAELIECQARALHELRDFLLDRSSEHENLGRRLAAELFDRVPLIYGPGDFYGVCRCWKIKFNENAKVQSFFNVFPELNHNEMVGFTRLVMKPTLIYLQSPWMHPRVGQRMEVMQALLKKSIPAFPVELEGGSHLQAMFESLAIADYASYHLAKAYQVDPAPVEMVEVFKKSLRSEAYDEPERWPSG